MLMLAEREAVCQPVRLAQPLLLVRTRASGELRRARGGEPGQWDAVGRAELRDVADEAGEHRHRPEPPTRVDEERRRELVRERPIPRLDPARQAPARRDDLPLERDDIAVELDLPQLATQPEREVGDAARVYACLAGDGRGRLAPFAL